METSSRLRGTHFGCFSGNLSQSVVVVAAAAVVLIIQLLFRTIMSVLIAAAFRLKFLVGNFDETIRKDVTEFLLLFMLSSMFDLSLCHLLICTCVRVRCDPSNH